MTDRIIISVDCRSMQKHYSSCHSNKMNIYCDGTESDFCEEALVVFVFGCICVRARQIGGSHQYGFPPSIKAAFYVPVKHSERMGRFDFCTVLPSVLQQPTARTPAGRVKRSHAVTQKRGEES